MESQRELPSDVAGVRIRDAQPDDRDFILGLVPELLAFDSPRTLNTTASAKFQSISIFPQHRERS